MRIDDETQARVVAFHGHLCPGLTMGMQAAQIARREIGPQAPDEEVVAVVETDMCAVDAIQVMTGCTFGKGNLIHRDVGKNAYTFFRRSDGHAIRVVGRPEAFGLDPEHRALFGKKKAGTATEAELARFRELHLARAEELRARDPDELFAVHEVYEPPPSMARIHATIICERCREGTMETRIRRFDGQELCIPCFEVALRGTPSAPIPGRDPLPMAGRRP
jgi:formylmethanofuran dehydrogenase subunit E